MTITVDFPASRIRVSSDQAALDVGALYTAIKDAQDSDVGIMYAPIAAGAGRFDLGGGRISGLVVRLNSPWQVEFDGSGQRTVDGGILVGGLDGQPVTLTPGTQVVLNRPADAFGVATSGSDPAAIAAAVWSAASGAQMAARLAEVWARLGLDASRPVVQDQTAITFGEVAMSLTEAAGQVTVARQ